MVNLVPFGEYHRLRCSARPGSPPVEVEPGYACKTAHLQSEKVAVAGRTSHARKPRLLPFRHSVLRNATRSDFCWSVNPIPKRWS